MISKVAVIGGGYSAEAEISRISASQIVKALRPLYDVRYIELALDIDVELQMFDPDVVFPVLHGPGGEDGTIQGFLDTLRLPYVGSEVRAAVLGMDKALAKQQFRAAGLPVLDDIVVGQRNRSEAEREILETFGESIVCKPKSQGSALGVTLLPNGGNLSEAIDSAMRYDDFVMVEPFVSGREITVGILDLYGSDAVALPVIEIVVAENEWYDYTNRYTPGRSDHVIPAALDQATTSEVQRIALVAHESLGCRDLSRVDFLLDQNDQIWLLEVNTMPGMTPTSLYPDACRTIGMEFEQLAALLVKSAYERRSQVRSLG